MWLPSSVLDITKGDTAVLVTLAHFYAIAVAAAPMFPAIDRTYFLNSRIIAIMQIYKTLAKTPVFRCSSCRQYHDTSRIMSYPATVVAFTSNRRTKNIFVE
jgi:hypothetical protein